MKYNLTLLFISFLLFFNCNSQQLKINKIEKDEKLKYILANIEVEKNNFYELFSGNLFVKTYIMDDFKATPDKFYEESDEILSSVLISVIPDGDIYTTSKLFKIEGLNNPKIKSITELKYPYFEIEIVFGLPNNRIRKIIKLKGL